MLDTMETLPDYVISRLITQRRLLIRRKADLCFAKLRIFAYTLPYISHCIDETKKLFPEAAKEKTIGENKSLQLYQQAFMRAFENIFNLKKGQ